MHSLGSPGRPAAARLIMQGTYSFSICVWLPELQWTHWFRIIKGAEDAIHEGVALVEPDVAQVHKLLEGIGKLVVAHRRSAKGYASDVR